MDNAFYIEKLNQTSKTLTLLYNRIKYTHDIITQILNRSVNMEIFIKNEYGRIDWSKHVFELFTTQRNTQKYTFDNILNNILQYIHTYASNTGIALQSKDAYLTALTEIQNKNYFKMYLKDIEVAIKNQMTMPLYKEAPFAFKTPILVAFQLNAPFEADYANVFHPSDTIIRDAMLIDYVEFTKKRKTLQARHIHNEIQIYSALATIARALHDSNIIKPSGNPAFDREKLKHITTVMTKIQPPTKKPDDYAPATTLSLLLENAHMRQDGQNDEAFLIQIQNKIYDLIALQPNDEYLFQRICIWSFAVQYYQDILPLYKRAQRLYPADIEKALQKSIGKVPSELKRWILERNIKKDILIWQIEAKALIANEIQTLKYIQENEPYDA